MKIGSLIAPFAAAFGVGIFFPGIQLWTQGVVFIVVFLMFIGRSD